MVSINPNHRFWKQPPPKGKRFSPSNALISPEEFLRQSAKESPTTRPRANYKGSSYFSFVEATFKKGLNELEDEHYDLASALDAACLGIESSDGSIPKEPVYTRHAVLYFQRSAPVLLFDSPLIENKDLLEKAIKENREGSYATVPEGLAEEIWKGATRNKDKYALLPVGSFALTSDSNRFAFRTLFGRTGERCQDELNIRKVYFNLVPAGEVMKYREPIISQVSFQLGSENRTPVISALEKSIHRKKLLLGKK